MRLFSIVAALAICLIACTLIGQERVCTPSGCYIVSSANRVQLAPIPQVVESVPVQVLQERSIVVESKNVRQPVRRVFANRPVRGFLKRIFCR